MLGRHLENDTRRYVRRALFLCRNTQSLSTAPSPRKVVVSTAKCTSHLVQSYVTCISQMTVLTIWDLQRSMKSVYACRTTKSSQALVGVPVG